LSKEQGNHKQHGGVRVGKLHQAYLLSFHPEALNATAFMDCIADLLGTPEVQSLKRL
jgi:hypothetical protein